MTPCILTPNLLTTTIVAPPSNASKWQMGFNSAFKGLMLRHKTGSTAICKKSEVLILAVERSRNYPVRRFLSELRFKLHSQIYAKGKTTRLLQVNFYN